MNNDIAELRSHLFDTLRGLRSKDAPMDIDRARAVSEVAKTIIDSAKVEVDYLRTTGETVGTGFITVGVQDDDAAPGRPLKIVDDKRGTQTTVEILEGARVTRHVAK
jgi:hypothetical protein